MTQLLEKAFQAASKLPQDDQNALAYWILEEIESEQIWDDLFERSRETLEILAEEALEEHRNGRTVPLDPQYL
jgi:hypothetical protein